MPIYEYVCDNGHRFEVIHGIHDAGPTECPVCHSTSVRKAFVPPAIHFKGSGWAKKDRKATSSPGSASKTEASGGDSAAAATTATEKPAKTDGSSSSSSSSSTSSTSTSGSGGD